MPMKYIRNEDGHFVCPFDDCNKVYANQNTMHYHMKKHQEILSYVCKVCKKGFLQKQTLDLHTKSRHPELLKDEENAKKFECPFDNCTFTALTKGNCRIHCLRIHFQDEIRKIMNVNQDTKTIECTVCDKEFGNSCGFYYHCAKCLQSDSNNDKYNILQLVL